MTAQVMMPGHCIVQAEFFYVGGRIKSNVRFFDRTGRLAKLVRRYDVLQKAHDKSLRDFLRTRGFKRSLADFRMNRALARLHNLKTKISRLTAKEVKLAAERHRVVAMEKVDRSFRPAQVQEVRELAEEIGEKPRVWLFVFAPSNIFGDTQKLVASML